jgi:hypothetical protein
MKEKDLYIENKKQEMILFAEKDDETYDAIQSGSYVVKHFLSDFYLKKENLEKALRADLIKGTISPVFYYLLIQDMGPGDLAKRVGISKRKLRKHFSADVFAKLDDVTLQKYAVIFGVSVAKLKNVE